VEEFTRRLEQIRGISFGFKEDRGDVPHERRVEKEKV